MLAQQGAVADTAIDRLNTILDEALPEDLSAEEIVIAEKQKVAEANQPALDRLLGIASMPQASRR